MYIRGESCDDDTLSLGGVEKPLKAVSNRSFGSGVPPPFSIGGVGHKRQYAPVAQFAEACKVYDIALNGRVVHLEVAGVHNYSRRGVDSKSHRVGYGMVHADKFHSHAAHFHGLARGNNVELRRGQYTVLPELSLDKTDSQPCSVYGNVHLFEQVGKSADVIFVTVGNDDTPYPVGVLLNVCKIGKNKVNAGHIAVGKSKSAVNDKYIVGAFKNGHVFAYFVKSAKGDNFQRRSFYRLVVCGVQGQTCGRVYFLSGSGNVPLFSFRRR